MGKNYNIYFILKIIFIGCDILSKNVNSNKMILTRGEGEMKIRACPECGNPRFFIWGEDQEKCQICGYFGKYIEFDNIDGYREYCEKHKFTKKKV